jgi:hypothetical protein
VRYEERILTYLDEFKYQFRIRAKLLLQKERTRLMIFERPFNLHDDR